MGILATLLDSVGTFLICSTVAMVGGHVRGVAGTSAGTGGVSGSDPVGDPVGEPWVLGLTEVLLQGLQLQRDLFWLVSLGTLASHLNLGQKEVL